ncbi:MAG: DUF4012 domain-containing protein [Candidatus Andersenbacteria bacterium]
MFDVLPPSGNGARGGHGNGGPSRRRRARPRVASVSTSRKTGPHTAAGSRIVQVEWKLPARLRKPIRDQLNKERRKKRRREAIVRFERRPIHTRPLVRHNPEITEDRGGFTLPRHRLFNRGAEHHTGDMYTKSRPQLQIATPPYVGNASGQNVTASRPKAPVAKAKHARPAKQLKRKNVRQSAARSIDTPKSRPIPVATIEQYGHASASDWYSERDVSYAFDGAPKTAEVATDLFVKVADTPTAVQAPQSKFALPLMVSLWPFSRSGDKGQELKTPKKKVRKSGSGGKLVNLGILLVGCAVVGGIVWNLQGLGRASAALSSIQSRSEQALEHVLSAQSALAETDVVASQTSFQQAQVLIGEAQAELDTALSAQGAILRILDVTGTVRSGQELLEVGSALTQAGQHVSEGLQPLLAAGSFVASGEGEQSSPTIVDAITTTRQDFEQALVELERADAAVQKVNSPLLPAAVKEHVETLKNSIPAATALVRTFVEQSNTFLYLLGAEHDRQYLILFANNHELRPIGGFIGTLGLVNIDQGRVENIDVQSVYDPDGQLKEFIAPPNPLLSIVDRWYLRDANWFVDYEVSAPKIAEFFEKEGGPTVDGVILFTPQVIQRLLGITGPIQVPGYDVEVSADNFFEVTQREVTYEYDRQLNKPKQFLADLTPLLLNRLFEPKEGATTNVEIMGALAEAIHHKDLLMYFRDAEAQKQIQKLHWSGSVPADKQGFVYVNNANIGGHKSDQFVEQELDYRNIITADGDVEVVLTIRRTHNGPTEIGETVYPEGENPAYKDNVIYQRVFVPAGAQLLEASGFTPPSEVPRPVLHKTDALLTGDADVIAWQAAQRQDASGTMIGAESGYTFFANWTVTKPGQTSVMLYRYRLPRHVSLPSLFDAVESYTVYMVKQPGDVRTTVRASLKIPSSLALTHIVPDAGLTRESDQSVVYRGQLTSDTQLGFVIEKN